MMIASLKGEIKMKKEYAVTISAWNKLVQEKILLESRLKEAQDETIVQAQELLIVNDAYKAMKQWKDSLQENVQSLSQRLSQAEALTKKISGQLVEESKDNYLAQFALKKKIQSLGERLSHLMDVAGKMAGALNELSKEIDDGPKHTGMTLVYLDKAKLALAEWDGIKESK